MELESSPDTVEPVNSSTSEVPATAPAMPEKLQAVYDVSPERMAIVHRSRSWPVVVFMSVWLTGWTAGCVFLTKRVIDEPKLETILFGLPFWIGWFAGFAILYYMLFGREELTVDGDGVHSIRRALWTLSRHTVPLEEIRRLRVADRIVDSESNSRQWGLEFQTIGKPLWALQGLPEPELRWLAWQFGQLLGVRPETASFIKPEVASGTPFAPERLVVEREVPVPPSDCEWEPATSFDELAFVNRGRFSLSALLIMLGVTLFWNGIVSVFLLSAFGIGFQGPQGFERWFLLLFLVPFELIGLALMGALLATLIEPFRVTHWWITREAATWRRAWLGLGQRKSWPIDRLDRLEIQSDTPVNWAMKRNASAPEFATFRLVFIEAENIEACQIRQLSEGEARWIGQLVLQTFPQWFPRMGTVSGN